uniref:Translocation associated membrane protein 2 n=1 Tax=Sus scrofa TaxID=9823 RepID=A0A8D1AS02_PIG
MPGIILCHNTLSHKHKLSHLFLTIALGGYFYPHFTDEPADAQGDGRAQRTQLISGRAGSSDPRARLFDNRETGQVPGGAFQFLPLSGSGGRGASLTPDPWGRLPPPPGLQLTPLNAVSSRPLQEGYLTNPRSLWEDYPHVYLPFQVKFFYLCQLAYWLHALPELYFQKVRKEEIPRQLQYICLYLVHIAGAYLLNLSRLGLVLLLLQYSTEFLFHTARLCHFADENNEKLFNAWAAVFGVTRLFILTLAVLAIGFGLARMENQAFDPEKGNFNTLLCRLCVLLLVCAAQAWLMWRFIHSQLRHWREYWSEQNAKRRVPTAPRLAARLIKRESGECQGSGEWRGEAPRGRWGPPGPGPGLPLPVGPQAPWLLLGPDTMRGGGEACGRGWQTRWALAPVGRAAAGEGGSGGTPARAPAHSLCPHLPSCSAPSVSQVAGSVSVFRVTSGAASPSPVLCLAWGLVCTRICFLSHQPSSRCGLLGRASCVFEPDTCAAGCDKEPGLAGVDMGCQAAARCASDFEQAHGGTSDSSKSSFSARGTLGKE